VLPADDPRRPVIRVSTRAPSPATGRDSCLWPAVPAASKRLGRPRRPRRPSPAWCNGAVVLQEHVLGITCPFHPKCDISDMNAHWCWHVWSVMSLARHSLWHGWSSSGARVEAQRRPFPVQDAPENRRPSGAEPSMAVW